MTDREKVIKGLENCKIHFCDDCPYDVEKDCTSYLHHDALELVKKQQEKIEELESDKRWDECPDTMGR